VRNLAIIPARSGSKGLKNKNIKDLLGKPLIQYSIDAAIQSGVFDEIMVSTDSDKYAEIARKCGASVPFIRNDETSSDVASSWDVVREVVDSYKRSGKEFDTVCLLQPTSPLRTASDIKAAYELFDLKHAKSVVSVCEVDHSPKWCNVLDESLSLNGFIKQDDAKARQLVGKYYRLNGAIYIVRLKNFLEANVLYCDGSYAYKMKRENSVDIDTELDFVIAKALAESLR